MRLKSRRNSEGSIAIRRRGAVSGAIEVGRAASEPIHSHQRSRVAKILIVLLCAFILNSLSLTGRTLVAYADQSSVLANSSVGKSAAGPSTGGQAAASAGAEIASTAGPSAGRGQAKNSNAKLKTATDPCLAAVPTPQLKSGLHRVVQLVNCSRSETLLGTADAAEQLGKQPLPYCREKEPGRCSPSERAPPARRMF